jgi:hypothetical protein
MKKFFKKHKRFFGIILLILALGFFAFWELIGRSKFLYSNVVVLKEDVLKGFEITHDMLQYIKIDSQGVIANCITNPDDIIGLEAKHYIPSGTQLVSNYFDVSSLVLKIDEKIMRLPDSWIHSFPDTLRRKDEVFIYAVKSHKENSNTGGISIDNTTKLNKDDENKEIYLLATKVAYVKDNSNKEVNSLDDDRLVGTSTISNIEIVIREEQFETLRVYAQDGYTFVLMYTK